MRANPNNLLEAKKEAALFDLLKREHRCLALLTETLHGTKVSQDRTLLLERCRKAFNHHALIEELSVQAALRLARPDLSEQIGQDHATIRELFDDLDELVTEDDTELWNQTVESLQDTMATHLFQIEEQVFEHVRGVLEGGEIDELRGHLERVYECAA